MAHKWTATIKTFNKSGELVDKKELDCRFRSLAEARENFTLLDVVYDGTPLQWKQFYGGRFDSRNFLYRHDEVGNEYQVWFEQVY